MIKIKLATRHIDLCGSSHFWDYVHGQLTTIFIIQVNFITKEFILLLINFVALAAYVYSKGIL